MNKFIKIVMAGLIAISIGCGSQDLFVPVCESEGQWCYMENGKDTGICEAFDEGLACNNCNICIGCSRIDLNTCEQTMCKVNTSQNLELGYASFAHMRFDEILSEKTCQEFKDLASKE